MKKAALNVLSSYIQEVADIGIEIRKLFLEIIKELWQGFTIFRVPKY